MKNTSKLLASENSAKLGSCNVKHADLSKISFVGSRKMKKK